MDCTNKSLRSQLLPQEYQVRSTNKSAWPAEPIRALGVSGPLFHQEHQQSHVSIKYQVSEKPQEPQVRCTNKRLRSIRSGAPIRVQGHQHQIEPQKSQIDCCHKNLSSLRSAAPKGASRAAGQLNQKDLEEYQVSCSNKRIRSLRSAAPKRATGVSTPIRALGLPSQLLQ